MLPDGRRLATLTDHEVPQGTWHSADLASNGQGLREQDTWSVSTSVHSEENQWGDRERHEDAIVAPISEVES